MRIFNSEDAKKCPVRAKANRLLPRRTDGEVVDGIKWQEIYILYIFALTVKINGVHARASVCHPRRVAGRQKVCWDENA